MLLMWAQTRCVFLLLCLTRLIAPNDAKKSGKKVHFLSANLSYDPDYMHEYTVNICPGGSTADIYAGVTRIVPYDLWLLITIALKTAHKQKSIRPMFEYDFNGCTAMSTLGTKGRGFLNAWMNNFWSTSHLPKSCPVLAGNYSWIGLKMDDLNIPSFLPNSKYDVSVFTYFRRNNKKKMLCNMNLVVEVK